MTTRKSKYWRDRIKKEMDAKEADDISLEQSMKQLHDYHFRNIEKEIESFYQRYADKEKIDLSEARKRASELDISAYQKKAKELIAKAEKLRKEGRTVTKADFTHQENADMAIYNLAMKTNALELLRLNIDLEMQELANGEHKLTKKFLDEGYRKEVEFQAGLLGLSVASQANVKNLADAVINANFKGAKWSDNIWDRQDKLRSIISQSVQSAILKGKNGLTIARDIRREFDVSASYAKRLAITEHARVQMEVGRLSMAENGFAMFDILPEPKACDVCKDIAKHGPYHLDKWRIGENSPPFHPYCRCAVVGLDKKQEEKVNDKSEKFENITPNLMPLFSKFASKITDLQRKIVYSDDLADTGYIRTPHAFDINNTLRNKGYNYLNVDDKLITDTLDSVISINSTPKNIKVYRFDDFELLGSINEQNNNIFDSGNFMDKLNQGGLSYTNDGYTSASYDVKKNVMGYRPIKTEIKVPKGSHVYLTDNEEESEIILPRGTKYDIINAKINEYEEIEITMEIRKE
ncbi:TPA: minor capsid protein [Streptococcus pyogenes]|nr:minor capsid protein [Streptococcus pyogenes]HEP5592621.1 minor capsid protein [Streptococcus pyogenes]